MLFSPIRLLFSALLVLGSASLLAQAPAGAPHNIVLLAGKKSHGPEGNRIHDYPWTVKLLKVLLDRSNIHEQITTEIHLDGWPKDESTLKDAATIVVVSDGRDGDQFEDALHLAGDERVAEVDRLLHGGCGLVTLHFSTFAPEKYRDKILDWDGGYFQWETDGKKQWYSAITIADADVSLPSPDHPVARGVKPYHVHEEFYYNLRFATGEPKVVPLLSAPPLKGREPDGNWVAWAKERADGGRGFGTSCGHFYDNWKIDDFRKLMLNAIAWTAHVEVPKAGVDSPYVEREEVTRALSGATP